VAAANPGESADESRRRRRGMGIAVSALAPGERGAAGPLAGGGECAAGFGAGRVGGRNRPGTPGQGAFCARGAPASPARSCG